MAVLSSTDRTLVSAAYQTDISLSGAVLSGVLRADVQTAVAAVDDWVVANAASYNAALPTAARTGLTASQKTRLLTYVIRKRYETGA